MAILPLKKFGVVELTRHHAPNRVVHEPAHPNPLAASAIMMNPRQASRFRNRCL